MPSETTEQLLVGNGYMQCYNDMLGIMLDMKDDLRGEVLKPIEVLYILQTSMEVTMKERKADNWQHPQEVVKIKKP